MGQVSCRVKRKKNQGESIVLSSGGGILSPVRLDSLSYPPSLDSPGDRSDERYFSFPIFPLQGSSFKLQGRMANGDNVEEDEIDIQTVETK